MFPDAHPLVQLATALVVVGGTAFVARRFGVSLSVADVPMSSAKFWWIMTLFAAPLGVVNEVVFADGLLLQLALIVLVAGGGLWIGERVFGWKHRF